MVDIEKYDELKTWYDKREFIRKYDNSKLSSPDWFGRKDYANMTITEIDERIAEITIEKARNENGQG